MDRADLHEYQVRAAEFIVRTPRCQLWLDMGLGKTIATLTAISDLYDMGRISRVLVIAPLRVAHHVWPAEIAAWQHVRWMRHKVIAGSPAERAAQLRGDEHIHIINYDLLPWLAEHFAKDWPYDCVVADEFSRLKSRRTRRWSSVRSHLGSIDRLIGLTGTPAPNGLIDLWAPAYLLDGGRRLGKTLTAYRQRWFFNPDGRGWKWAPLSHAENEIKTRLSDITLSMRANDYLELPPKLNNVIRVQLPPNAIEKYRRLEREMYVELQKESVFAANAGALVTKCAQYANGAMYVGDMNAPDRAWEEVHRSKLDALEEVVEEAEGESILVGYTFKSDLARIKRRFPQAVDIYTDSGRVIEAWNRGEVPMLVGHPASMGHGLNLQGGGRTIVWFGLPWSLELYEQTNARLYRQGQTRPTVVHHIVCDKTVDLQIMDVLQKKQSLQDALLSAMRAQGYA